MAEKIGKKEENIQNPGTRVLRFKNPNPFFVKNPGTQPGLGTRVKTLRLGKYSKCTFTFQNCLKSNFIST